MSQNCFHCGATQPHDWRAMMEHSERWGRFTRNLAAVAALIAFAFGLWEGYQLGQREPIRPQKVEQAR